MAKKKVGIVSAACLFENDNPYLDNYYFVNDYVKHVEAAGGIPIGVLPVDAFVAEDMLDVCDSFIICGGRRIHPYHFQVVEHAVRTGKPLLGVCMGMQAIHSYFIVEDEAKRRGFEGSLLELYNIMKKEHYMFVEPVAHHWDKHMIRGHQDDLKHPVKIEKGTELYRILKESGVIGAGLAESLMKNIGAGTGGVRAEDAAGESVNRVSGIEESNSQNAGAGISDNDKGGNWIMGASMHNYRITTPSDRLKISARTEDGTIEGIELAGGEHSSLIGIQFHPEVDDVLHGLFEFLA